MTDDPFKALEDLGAAETPPVDAHFADRLESRLRVEHATMDTRRRTPGLLPRLGVAVALVVAGVIGVVALSGRDAGVPLEVVDGAQATAEAAAAVDGSDAADGTDGDSGDAGIEGSDVAGGSPDEPADVGTARPSPTATPRPTSTVAPADVPTLPDAEDPPADDGLAPGATPTQPAPDPSPEPSVEPIQAPSPTPLPTRSPDLAPTPTPTTEPPPPSPTPRVTDVRPTPTPMPVDLTPQPLPTATSSPTPEPTPTRDVVRIDLECRPRVSGDAVGVVCEWSRIDATDVTTYRVMRSVNGSETIAVANRRADSPTTYVDREVQSGDRSSYIVRALAGDRVVGVSERQVVVVP